MSFTEKCARCILVLSYVLLWAACLCLLYVGSRAVILADTYAALASETQLRVAGITFICTALLILAVCILGLFAWLKRSRVLLVIICSMLVVVLFCEIGAVLLSVFHWSGVESNLSRMFKVQMDKYAENPDAKKTVDQVQSTLQCCGSENYVDWNVTTYYKDSNDYPASCYSEQATTTTTPQPLFDDLNPVENAPQRVGPYQRGCMSLLSESFHFWFSIIIASGLVFVLIQILGSHTSCIVFCHASPTAAQPWTEEQYARL